MALGIRHRILVISTELSDHAPLNVQAELKALQDELHGWKFQIDYVFRASRVDILDKLQQPASIIHIVSHGGGVIPVHSPSSSSTAITKEWLLEALGGHPAKLVFVNTCQNAEIAKALVEAPNCKVAAAIGWEDPVEDQAAIDFASQFYRRLGLGETLDKAFSFAKLASDEQPGQTPEFYLRRPRFRRIRFRVSNLMVGVFLLLLIIASGLTWYYMTRSNGDGFGKENDTSTASASGTCQ